MQPEEYFKAITVLAAIFGVYLTSIKVKRDGKADLRQNLLRDIEILKEISKTDTFYHPRIKAKIEKDIQKTYPPNKLYNSVLGIIGLGVTVISATLGILLMLKNNDWAWACFITTIFGIEMQRQSVLPEFGKGTPSLILHDDDT